MDDPIVTPEILQALKNTLSPTLNKSGMVLRAIKNEGQLSRKAAGHQVVVRRSYTHA